MIKHIFKLVWNRKKRISLLLIEIFLSFVVAFIAWDMLITNISSFVSPLGFNYKDILVIRISAPEGVPFWKLGPENPTKYRMLLDEIKSLPQVRQASYILGNIPYGNIRIGTGFQYNGKEFNNGVNYVGEEYYETLQLSLVEGRWFTPEDVAGVDIPIVIDEKIKQDMFGEDNAVGKKIQEPDHRKKNDLATQYNIIGVVKTVRPYGEFQQATGESFIYQPWDDSSYTPYAALVKVREGANVSFELDLQRRLESLAPDFNFIINPLTESRESKLRDTGITVAIPLIISIFLLFNVMLGLFGIFWQSINRRRGEIGLRRAVGGSSVAIQLQILGESLVIGTLAIIAGIPVVVNLAVLGISGPIGSFVFFLSFICASAVIYLILTVCAIYPSYMAAHVRPAEALHNE